jgi:hypothetical protein
MNIIMRLTSVVFFCLIAATGFAFFFWYKPKASKNFISSKLVKPTTAKLSTKLSISPVSLKKYLKANKFNTTHCFLIDMKIESNKKRLFVYNVLKDSVELSGLVTHGSSTSQTEEIVFSNQPNSLCTSLGRYKIGKSYNGKFGLAYKLYGLDSSNSNAFNRFVVLHSHECVPANEVNYAICQSWGCPTVAPVFLQQLQQYIDKSSKPILLSIYK